MYWYNIIGYFLPCLIWTIAIATDPVNARVSTIPTNAFLLFYTMQWFLGIVTGILMAINIKGVERWYYIRVTLGLHDEDFIIIKNLKQK